MLELGVDTLHRVLDCPEGTYGLDATHRAAPLQCVGRIGVEFVSVRLAPQSLTIGLDHHGEFDGVDLPHGPVEFLQIEIEPTLGEVVLTIGEPVDHVAQRHGDVWVKIVPRRGHLHESNRSTCGVLGGGCLVRDERVPEQPRIPYRFRDEKLAGKTEGIDDAGVRHHTGGRHKAHHPATGRRYPDTAAAAAAAPPLDPPAL